MVFRAVVCKSKTNGVSQWKQNKEDHPCNAGINVTVRVRFTTSEDIQR
ncbi:Uncharacterised protein [Vibrio cholerae]|nr:Uncharacterised protein [Vibrio cholerae]